MSPSAAQPAILVIDDEAQIRRLLRVTLEAAGNTVRDAETGALGLDAAAVARPDAVILDLSLPDQSGLDVLRRLREWTTVPVLVLSVRGSGNHLPRIGRGADGAEVGRAGAPRARPAGTSA